MLVNSKRFLTSNTNDFVEPQVPLCQGKQVTCLNLQNDSYCAQRMEFSADGGRTWTNFGILDPVNTTLSWRQQGEMWRMRSTKTGHVTVQGTTQGPTMMLRVPGDTPPGWRFGYRGMSN